MKGITVMNAIDETAFAILGPSSLVSGVSALLVWAAVIALIGLL
jgi:hypothetical protein